MSIHQRVHPSAHPLESRQRVRLHLSAIAGEHARVGALVAACHAPLSCDQRSHITRTRRVRVGRVRPLAANATRHICLYPCEHTHSGHDSTTQRPSAGVHRAAYLLGGDSRSTYPYTPTKTNRLRGFSRIVGDFGAADSVAVAIPHGLHVADSFQTGSIPHLNF